ncbi:kelch repeat-containing protein [Sorangium sp. So ce291]|uniref:Kelch repeat-containing protein n=1 Tax=Sorangium sp. So ce291 TaxID=3133294 RepID=UPI003F5FBAE2
MSHWNRSLRLTFGMLAAASALLALGCGDDGAQPAAPGTGGGPGTPDVEPEVQTARDYPDLIEAVSSFGAVLLDNALYTYGGNLGGDFAADNQSSAFRRLSLAPGGAWEELGAVEHLESTALVAHGGLVVRVGGLRADNAAGDPEELFSVSTVERYDPSTGKWQALPDMPEGRSGHGAVIVGDRLYVVAGWELIGAGEFRTGGFMLDLSAPDAAWVPLPDPPFQLRSLGVAKRGDVIYAMGGVGDAQEFSSAVYTFDTKTETWAPGPELPSEIPIKGFGATACSDDEDLYVNYADGLFRLNEAGDGWEPAGELAFTRYFSPLICPGNGEVIVVGGRSTANNEITASVESVDVAQ